MTSSGPISRKWSRVLPKSAWPRLSPDIPENLRFGDVVKTDNGEVAMFVGGDDEGWGAVIILAGGYAGRMIYADRKEMKIIESHDTLGMQE